jgi:NAD+ diphosphatase
VFEETGLTVREVRYVSSQPWPMPASLMLGFTAVVDGDAEPVAHDGELEDARWFTKAELQDGTSMLPTPVSIAYLLITRWLSET